MTIFGPDQLAVLVTQTLPDVGADHQLVVVGTVDQTGAQVVAGWISHDGAWQFQGAYHHDWATKDDAIGARVIYTR